MRLRLRPDGRGRRYSMARGLVESGLEVLWGDWWAARLWGRVPGACSVALLEATLPVLPAGMPALKIGFVSDLHLGATTPPALLDRAFELLGEAELDLLLLGGDYVFLEATPARCEELAERVAAVRAGLKVAVLGNHDLWTFHDRLEAVLVSVGVEVAINRSVRLPAPWEEVCVVALDEPWTGDPDVSAALAGATAVKVGLCHSPDGMSLLSEAGLVTLFCGHTHGGHVALPNRPLILPSPGSKLWPAGRYLVGDTELFVSRGIGGVEVPFRTFAPPDVWVVTLVAG